MAMFKKPIRIYGKHALIMQKYCKDKGGDQEVKFSISDNEGFVNDHFYVFETRIDLYMIAAMLGIIYQKQSEEDVNKKIYSSIMADMVEKQRNNLERIYHHMVLSDSSIDSVDLKIKKAFSIIPTEEECDKEEAKLESYVRGGLEIVDNAFSNCKTYEDICNAIIDLISMLHVSDLVADE